MARGCVDHNYVDLYEDAIQACLQASEWDEVERYALAPVEYAEQHSNALEKEQNLGRIFAHVVA